MIRAIETPYNGYRFRSRLEARWAVFFDALGIAYQYEPEAFDLGDGVCYLPDFWLPELGYWLEIKPEAKLSADDERKCTAFACANWESETAQFRILAGQPWRTVEESAYEVLCPLAECGTGGVTFHNVGYLWTDCPLCGHVGIALSSSWWGMTADGEEEESLDCRRCDDPEQRGARPRRRGAAYFHKGLVATTDRHFFVNSPRLQQAYHAARSARFDPKGKSA